MAVLGVANGLQQLAGMVDAVYREANVQATIWWLEGGDRIEPLVSEVVTVLPTLQVLVMAADLGYLPGPELAEGTSELVDAVTELAEGWEAPEEPEQTAPEPEPLSTVIGGPELEAAVQEVQRESEQETQRRDLAAALDRGEQAFWSRNEGLEGEARKEAEVRLEEARKEALRALEARQKEERERTGPDL